MNGPQPLSLPVRFSQRKEKLCRFSFPSSAKKRITLPAAMPHRFRQLRRRRLRPRLSAQIRERGFSFAVKPSIFFSATTATEKLLHCSAFRFTQFANGRGHIGKANSPLSLHDVLFRRRTGADRRHEQIGHAAGRNSQAAADSGAVRAVDSGAESQGSRCGGLNRLVQPTIGAVPPASIGRRRIRMKNKL